MSKPICGSTHRNFPVCVIEDLIPVDLYRQPEFVETVQEIVAACHETSQPQRRETQREMLSPRYIIIRSLISGCSTASMMLSKQSVSIGSPNRIGDLYHVASS